MRPIGILVGTVVGLLAGYAIGSRVPFGRSDTRQATAEQQKESVATRPAPANQATGAPSSPEAPAPIRVTPGEKVRALLELKSAAQRAFEAETYFATLTEDELPGAFETLAALPRGLIRSQLLSQLFRRWGQVNGAAAMKVIDGLPGRDRISMEGRVLDGWAEVDPQAAWDYARVSMAENSMFFGAGGTVQAFARHDLASAIKDIAALPSNTGRMSCRTAVIAAATEDGNLDEVVRTLIGQTDGNERDEWIRTAFASWGEIDSDAPLAALRAIDDPELARTAMTGFISGWSQLDPHGAIDFILDHPDDPLVSGSLASTLGSSVRFLKEAELRDIFTSVQAKGAFDAIAPQVISSIAFQHPTLALEFASSIKDDQDRVNQTSSALMFWARNDFPAAAAYYDNLPASPDKLNLFRNLSMAALGQDGGSSAVARWVASFQGADRVKAVQGLLSSLEFQARRNPQPLRAADAAVLRQAVADTPDLPAAVVDRSRKLFGSLPPQ